MLTAVCIVIAFVLLGLLEGVNAGFARAIAAAHRDALVTATRVRGAPPIPLSAMAKIQSFSGVKEVAPRAYLMGGYGDPGLNNTVAAIATNPEIFCRFFAGARVASQELSAMRENRAGMLVTRPLLEHFGWKVGDTITLRSSTLKTDGSANWTFEIVGVLDTRQPAYFGLINYVYLDEYRAKDRGTAELFYVRIADPNRAVAMSAAIDQLFANSPHETRTRSQQARAELQSKQMGDVGFFTKAIMGAVLFTLAFVTGNTLRQALQERVREFAVLRALGYSGARVLSLAFAEALLLCVPAAVLGLLIARLLAPLAQEDIGAIYVSPTVAATGLLCAAGIALMSAALPASNLARMPLAAALGKR
jgi:putative ABC transport system permease protein